MATISCGRRANRRQRRHCSGLIEGTDATLKRFFREPSGNVRLQPANAQMDPILVPARDVKIQGRVVGVLRKY